MFEGSKGFVKRLVMKINCISAASNAHFCQANPHVVMSSRGGGLPVRVDLEEDPRDADICRHQSIKEKQKKICSDPFYQRVSSLRFCQYAYFAHP